MLSGKVTLSPLLARRCGRNRMPAVSPPVWTASDARRWPAGVDGTGCPPRAEAEDVSLTRPLDPADDWSACQNPSKACVLLFSKDVSTVLNGSLKKKKKKMVLGKRRRKNMYQSLSLWQSLRQSVSSSVEKVPQPLVQTRGGGVVHARVPA